MRARSGCEGIDRRLVDEMTWKGIHPQDVELLPEGSGWLMVEFGGDDARRRRTRRRTADGRGCAARPSMKLFDDEKEEEQLWKVRESGLGATARKVHGKENWEGWEDSAVPPERLGEYLRKLRKLLRRVRLRRRALRPLRPRLRAHPHRLRPARPRRASRSTARFIDEAVDLVVAHGGSISGEHGDGQSKAEFLPRMFGEDLVRAFGEFKAIWDPDWKMNPGKVVRRRTASTRTCASALHYRPPAPQTHFQYQDDDFSFAKATARCVGIGECRKTSGGTMCPSYMVTMEEMHSTRGRAHLLFEMLQGDPLRGGLARRRREGGARPLPGVQGVQGRVPGERGHGHVQGRVPLASLPGPAPAARRVRDGPDPLVGAARLARAGAGERASPARALFKRLGGDRRRSARSRGSRRRRSAPGSGARPRGEPGGERVMLWADTFNNFFHPEVAQAAVEVLEDGGLPGGVQAEKLCCGRPLYDYGMLDLAKRKLRQILDDARGGDRARARRWSGWSRAASPSSATSCSGSFPTT